MQQRAIEKLEYSFCVFTPLDEKELPSIQLITVLWKQTFSVLPIVNCTSLSRPLIGFSPSSWFWYTVFFVLSCYSRVWLFCDPMDCSPPNSSIHGILQARIPEWVSTSFSRGTFQPRNWTQVSHTAGRCFTNWAMQKTHYLTLVWYICSNDYS